ncbi:hypothetical protein ACRYCC_41160 [Actinomadura scrupuli]|uniref:hypothetical protein n=1 Tax=Actinomadura scrupuli TaxID=559629 RepID=UPI003D972AE7
MIWFELPNLSLLLIDRQEYAAYARQGGVNDSGEPVPGENEHRRRYKQGTMTAYNIEALDK